MAATLELEKQAVDTVRIYADISAEVRRKLEFRRLTHESKTGVRMTRKEYLEHLINEDAKKIEGASLREVSSRSKK